MRVRHTTGWFGWVIVIVGVLWALSIIGVAHASLGSLIATWWPAIIALWGFVALFDRGFHHQRGFFLPLTAIVVGLLILAGNLNLFRLSSGQVWLLILALVVIAIGLEDALGRRWWKHGRTIRYDIGNASRETGPRSFSALDREIHLPLGEVEFDVGEEELPAGDTALDVSVHMGSVRIGIDSHVGLMVHAQVGVGEIRLADIVAEGANRAADYTSENYERAAKRLTLRVSASVGSISVQHG